MKLDLNLDRVEVWASWYDSNKPPTSTSLKSAIDQIRIGSAIAVSPSKIYVFEKQQKRAKLKRKILERDNYICHYCGKYGDTLDHKTPRSKGGCSISTNLVCSCRKCNEQKANKDYQEFLKEIN